MQHAKKSKQNQHFSSIAKAGPTTNLVKVIKQNSYDFIA